MFFGFGETLYNWSPEFLEWSAFGALKKKESREHAINFRLGTFEVKFNQKVIFSWSAVKHVGSYYCLLKVCVCVS